MTISIMAISIMTISLMTQQMTLSKMTKHNDNQHCTYVRIPHILLLCSVVLMNGTVHSVIMLIVVAPKECAKTRTAFFDSLFKRCYNNWLKVNRPIDNGTVHFKKCKQ